jgi:hypothetical protein
MIGQRAGVLRGDFFQYRRFALRAKYGLIVFLFDVTDRLREFGALVEQVKELRVHRVNLGADGGEVCVDDLMVCGVLIHVVPLPCGVGWAVPTSLFLNHAVLHWETVGSAHPTV